MLVNPDSSSSEQHWAALWQRPKANGEQKAAGADVELTGEDVGVGAFIGLSRAVASLARLAVA